ncbi:hypothetical protein GCM10019016_105570 [Streptomyces prasinosporus]|uniref:Uncharacterized protein n=1 Tax=Streptomyces prasinosporus TaxID=68256 RepID=A0ABP6U793_9ACTN
MGAGALEPYMAPRGLGVVVAGEQGAWSDREDLAPTSPGYQPGEGSEPEPADRLVVDRAGDLPAQDCVLVPQHEQLGAIHGVTAQQHRRDGHNLRAALHSRDTLTRTRSQDRTAPLPLNR